MTVQTAVEPSRVLLLDETEQRMLLDALHGQPGDRGRRALLAARIADGDTYQNATDELARVTLRKRRLEAEIKRCNQQIARAEQEVCDQMSQMGLSKVGHDATGATLRLDQKVWAKLDVDTDNLSRDEAEEIRAAVKAQAGRALIDAGLGEFVREDFNLNSVSAYFREQIKTYNERQRELPEHERQPRPADSFLPEQLRGLLRLDDSPRIQVRAS